MARERQLNCRKCLVCRSDRGSVGRMDEWPRRNTPFSRQLKERRVLQNDPDKVARLHFDRYSAIYLVSLRIQGTHLLVSVEDL